MRGPVTFDSRVGMEKRGLEYGASRVLKVSPAFPKAVGPGQSPGRASQGAKYPGEALAGRRKLEPNGRKDETVGRALKWLSGRTMFRLRFGKGSMLSKARAAYKRLCRRGLPVGKQRF